MAKEVNTKEDVSQQDPVEKIKDPVGDFTPEELNEFQIKCKNLERHARACETKWNDAKEDTKNAKGVFDDAVSSLRRYITGFKEVPLLAAAEDAWRDIPVEEVEELDIIEETYLQGIEGIGD